ncbi:MAG: crnA [Candidatus Aminicenantes bacterium]|nr:crnA [Candidatus Aminicenantes bacterium]
MKTIRMEEMTWPDIREAIERGFTTVVTAVGSTEQHGPHLPTMTDTRIGDAVANAVALKLGRALQARTIPFGCSDHHLAFGGTISMKPDTLRMIIRDYADSLVRDGFKRIVFLPSHGGNFAPVGQAIEEARRAHPGIEITGYTDLHGFVDVLYAASAEFGISQDESGAHSGENETSFMMALEGGLVAAERMVPGYLGPLGDAEITTIFEKGMPALTNIGVLGDPRRASAEKGRRYLERLADFLVKSLTQPD